MSTTGLIQTDANWNLNAPAGNLVLNYNVLNREAPQYSASFSTGVGSSYVIINTNDITQQGIYLLTISATMSSTPWRLSYSAFVPLGYQGLTSILSSYTERFNGLVSFHAQNGVSYDLQFRYNTIGTNYHRPGLTITTSNNCSAGSWVVQCYRIVQ